MPMPSIGAFCRANPTSVSSSIPPLAKISGILQSAFVQNAAHHLGQCREIAAVDPYRTHRNSEFFQPRRQRNHFSRGGYRVVGIDQEGKVLGSGARKGLEGCSSSSKD